MSTLAVEASPLKICAIGASAGGLAPVEEFFDSVAPDTGMAFVVVQHLSPDHESMMVQLLASHTEMPIEQAVDNSPLNANHVYLIPPGGELTVHDGRLRVRKRDTDRRHLHRPIDVFFVSMAREYSTRSVAVILSGTGSDGTAGIEQVARSGGLALVQDDSAAFEGMPDAAVRSGFVDAVLSPSEIATAVVDFAKSSVRPESLPDQQGLDPLEALIMADLEKLSGINFSEYKPGTLRRRLERRISLANISMEEYAEQLVVNQEERQELIHDLLIDVTNFFRDVELYDDLAERVIPRLVDEAVSNESAVRVWSAGCATGEEPYSLAMLLLERMENIQGDPPVIQIFATDVHTGALEEASTGRYDDSRMVGVSYERRMAFFDRVQDGWQIKAEVRNLITFAQHNVLADAPFTRVDLVTCRNMLIYFRRPAQERAIGSMAFALRLGGVMVLGPSETLGVVESDFTVLNGAWRVWEKAGDAVRRAYRPSTVPTRSVLPKRTPTYSSDQKVLRAYDMVLDSQFAGGLLISESRELIHTMGSATAWLQQPAGRPTLDALAMIGDQNLRLSMSAALREMEQGALESKQRQVITQAAAKGESEAAMLCGRRLKVGNDQLFVLFTRPIDAPIQTSALAAPLAIPDGQSTYVDQLEAELGYVRESLQSAVEEQETSNEELNAANEELIASNEELQSTNEELSSVNEELRTLNDEHRRQLDQVLDLSADLEQLMSSTDIGVVFLAEDRTIRRFNEPARDYFRVRESDVGRPFEDIITLLDSEDLDADIESAFSSGEAHTRPVKLRDQPTRHLLVKVDRYELPRRRWGVFVAIVDISEATIADQEKMLATYLRAAPVSVEVWDPENVCLYANQLSLDEAGIEHKAGQTVSALYERDVADMISSENSSASTAGRVTMLRPIGPGPEASDYVISKFPIDIDGRVHVGALAIPADHVQDLNELKEDRLVLDRLVEAGLVRTWKLQLGADATSGSDALAPSTQASTSDSSDEEGHAIELDELSRNVSRRAPSDQPPVVLLHNSNSSEPQWVEVHNLRFDEERTLVVAINIDRHRSEAVAKGDEAGRLAMELGETRASGARRSADLAERNLDLDNFAHVAAHDLKAPIRSVRSFSEMALDEIPDGSPAQKHIGQVIDASRRMGELVESLLNFASIDREPAKRDLIKMRSVIDDVQIDLGSTIEATQAEVVLLNSVPNVEGSTEGMRQVMSNLIGNAIKYRSGLAPRIEISSTIEDEGVTIVVADNGIGFDPGQADRMFEPFQRLHPTAVSGSGVGLAICRRIVQRHNGRIWATSEPGQGSRFSMWLPLRAAGADVNLSDVGGDIEVDLIAADPHPGEDRS